MTVSLWLVGFIILVALVFDFINGFHDAANSIATVVSTRVLTPMQAVCSVWAGLGMFRQMSHASPTPSWSPSA